MQRLICPSCRHDLAENSELIEKIQTRRPSSQQTFRKLGKWLSLGGGRSISGEGGGATATAAAASVLF